MKLVKIGFLLFGAQLFYSAVFAQTKIDNPKYPTVGEPCPSYKLSDINYYSGKVFHKGGSGGKWLILDFWGTNCSSCVESFPKYNKLKDEFNKDVDFILVGRPTDGHIKELFSKYKAKEQLTFDCAYDSAIFSDWAIQYVPYLVVIDSQGIVRATTASLDSAYLADLLAGRSATILPSINDFMRKPRKVEDSLNHPGSIVFASEISRFDPSSAVPRFQFDIMGNSRRGSFFANGVALFRLFNYAYWGRYGADLVQSDSSGTYGIYCDTPVLNVTKSDVFDHSYVSGKNLFSYNLRLDPMIFFEDHVKEIMQIDLKDAFGVVGHFEKRYYKCWYLTASDSTAAIVRTKGGPTTSVGTLRSNIYSVTNFDFKDFVHDIRRISEHQVILDSTGIDEKIDLANLSVPMVSIEDANVSLKRLGLKIIPGETLMKVLVLEDAK